MAKTKHKRAEARPGPAKREALRAQEVQEELRRQVCRPSCELTLSRGEISHFDSHVGGLPYCPRDGELPVGEKGDQLRLVVQINFAQMPPMPPFPDRGILQFFFADHDPLAGYRGMEHWTEQGNWRIVYHREPDPTVTAEEIAQKLRIGPVVTHDHEKRIAYLNNPVLIAEKPYKVHFGPPEREGTIVQEGITVKDFRFWPAFLNVWRSKFQDPPPEQFWPKRPRDPKIPGQIQVFDVAMADDIWKKLRNQADGEGNKLGGFPGFRREDPRPVLPECADGACPWDTLLLQLSGPFIHVNNRLQGANPIYFGEDGWANFFIREEDLLRCDFSRVGYYWQEGIVPPEYYRELYGHDYNPTARDALTP